MSANDSYHKSAISYSLKAEIKGNPKINLATQASVIVKQRFLNDYKSKAKMQSKALAKFLRYDPKEGKGLKITILKNHFEPDEIIKMVITEGDSNSHIQLKTIDVSLHRVVSFNYSKDLKAFRSFVVCNSHILADKTTEENLSNPNTVNAKFPLKMKNNKFQDCGSVRGKIIKSKYLLEISTGYESFAPKKRSFIPIIVYPKTCSIKKTKTIPNLTEMEVTTIDMN